MPTLCQDTNRHDSLRTSPAFAATFDILVAIARSELLPLPGVTASFVALFRVLDDAVTPPDHRLCYESFGDLYWMAPSFPHVFATTPTR